MANIINRGGGFRGVQFYYQGGGGKHGFCPVAAAAAMNGIPSVFSHRQFFKTKLFRPENLLARASALWPQTVAASLFLSFTSNRITPILVSCITPFQAFMNKKNSPYQWR